MSLIGRLLGRDNAVAKALASATDRMSWFVDWVRGGSDAIIGISVTPTTAMQCAAVWACVNVRSGDIGKLPTILYRRLPNGGKQRAEEHPVYDLIKNRPNPRMTAFEFKQLLQSCVDLYGNGYAEKEFNGNGELLALWPLDPTKVTVLMTPDGKDLFYKVGESKTLPAEAILHLRGYSRDGIVGLSPIGEHRETIGLAISARKYGSAFFSNSAMPRGGVKVPGVLSTEAASGLRASWDQKYKGVERSNQVAIFDGGMEWVQMGMNNTDAQYLELRDMQNRDIWRIYRVPAHKVGDLEKSTNNNIEHQGLEYVTDCLMTEMVRWEQTLSRDLLTPTERKTLFFEFLPDALLRGDIKSRYEAYAIARNWGWLSVNDIRERENLNHVAKNGDIYLQPMNMVPAGTPPAPPKAAGTPTLPTPGAKAALLLLAHELGHELPDDATIAAALPAVVPEPPGPEATSAPEPATPPVD